MQNDERLAIHCWNVFSTSAKESLRSLAMVSILLMPLFDPQVANADSIETIAGTGVKGFSGDGGPSNLAQLNNPYAVARGPDGHIYFCDIDNHRIRRINSDGTIQTVVGCGEQGYHGDGGLAVHAKLNQPYELSWDSAGNLYFVDMRNHCVRRVDEKTQIITTIAGNGVAGFSGDGGPAVAAQLNQPHSLAIAPDGDLYVCDILNHRIRRIDLTTNTIETFAGNGRKETSPDGTPISQSSLHGPRAIAFDSHGNAWLALREGNSLIHLDMKTDRLRRVAGTGKSGFTGNGGPALEATLSGPKGIAIDPHGRILLADTESHSIRYFDPSKNTIELLIGDGIQGDGPDGDVPQKCRLARPHGVFADRDGTIWIGDSENHRIRVWHP